MANAPRRPKALEFQMFRGTAAINDGFVTPSQLRSGAWTRIRSDVYLDSRVEADHAVKVRAAVLGLRDGVVVAGQSAAVLLGVDHAAGDHDPVHLITPGNLRLGHRHGLQIHNCDLRTGEVEIRAGLPCTSAVRTAWDVGRWLEPLLSVPIIDSLLGRGLVTVEMLDEIAVVYDGGRGGRRAKTAFGLADGGAQSRPESVLRVRFVISGLPRPVLQYPIVLPNGVTAHPDITWPEYRVACEYDGLWHGESSRIHLDRQRLNGLVSAGWIVLHVTSKRLSQDYNGVLNEVRTALISRGWRP